MPYNVYVIELDKEIMKSKKFRKRNPKMNPRLPCLYVGQTAHPPEVRFKQHKEGYKSNSFVRRYGMRLLPKFYTQNNPIQTRKNAEYVEQQLTIKLREKGYGVWSN